MTIALKTPIPGPRSQELMKRRQAAVARGPFHTTPVFVARAHGAVLEDVDGNRLIDFASGIGVVNVWHTADAVVDALRKQAGELIHASFNVTPYEGYIRLAEKLNRATPGSFAKKTFLANSGAEAVENAVKIARAFTGRTGVVAFEHGFHGRTYMAMALTYKEKPYKAGFGPFDFEVKRAPFPHPYRWAGAADAEGCSHECFERFESVALELSAKPAAVVIEPVLGEGGFIPVPREFLARLRKYCDDNGVVLIADEIQSGFGRTGTLFASEQLGLVPDLLVSAKGLGGGMPISAVTGKAEIMDAPGEGGIGGTFGGNPLACAAALAVFEIFEKESLARRAQELGTRVEKKLREWQKKFPTIGEVRGLGPMQAMEFVKDPSTKEPSPEKAKALVRYAYEHGLIVMTAGSLGNVVRLLMPLVIETAELEEGFAVLEAGLREISR